MRLGYLASRSSQLGRGAAELSAQAGRLTDGRIRVEVYPNSQLGAESELLQGVAAGTVDVAFLTSAVLGAFLQPLGIFDIPFLFRDLAHARAVMDGPIGQDALQAFRARGVVGLAWGENGFRHLTTAARPVRTAANMKGLRIRVPQSDVMLTAFRALGTDAQPLAFNELYGALATGRFEAQENPISTITASRFYAVQKHLTLTGHVYSPAVIVINGAAFDRIALPDQAALQQAAKAGAKVSRTASEIADGNGVADLQAKGMQVIRDCDRDSFVAAMAGAEPTFVKLFGQDRIQAVRNTKAG
ncbi:MAG TPA: DctP family TRAP transporter solute-binding subunit [Rhodopila sp.]|nr:DctP family TRAP transporter solute-binding subunit [Rhodopila sp.]